MKKLLVGLFVATSLFAQASFISPATEQLVPRASAANTLSYHKQPTLTYGYNQKGQKIAGYIAPSEVLIVVPNTQNDVGGGGTSSYPSIESKLQLTVQMLVGNFTTQTLSDADVQQKLSDDAESEAAWNGNLDPGAHNIPALVAFYVKVFRAAVTPIQ